MRHSRGDLDRARQLTFAANEEAAKELLLSLGCQIEEADRDDLMMEVLAQLGEIYLVRTAYDGVREAIRRIDECLAVYRSIRAGTNPEAAAQVTMSEAEVDHMLCRYTRRAQFLRDRAGGRRARGPRGSRARAAGAACRRVRRGLPGSGRRASVPDHVRARSSAQPRCATTICTCSRFHCGRR